MNQINDLINIQTHRDTLLARVILCNQSGVFVLIKHENFLKYLTATVQIDPVQDAVIVLPHAFCYKMNRSVYLREERQRMLLCHHVRRYLKMKKAATRIQTAYVRYAWAFPNGPMFKCLLLRYSVAA